MKSKENETRNVDERNQSAWRRKISPRRNNQSKPGVIEILSGYMKIEKKKAYTNQSKSEEIESIEEHQSNQHISREKSAKKNRNQYHSMKSILNNVTFITWKEKINRLRNPHQWRKWNGVKWPHYGLHDNQSGHIFEEKKNENRAKNRNTHGNRNDEMKKENNSNRRRNIKYREENEMAKKKMRRNPTHIE